MIRRAVVRPAEGLPVLVWRFAEPLLAVSSAPLGGGIGVRGWAVDAQVESGYDHPDPESHLRQIAAGLGLDGPGVGFLTAASVESVARGDDGGVVVDATVGVTRPTWAAAPAEPARSKAPARQPAGTINVLASIPCRLADAALVNAVATATEAKAQALHELGVPGTGTATDAVCVVCPPQGAAEPYGGPRSRWGAPLARAVHAAVRRGFEDGRRRSAASGAGRAADSAADS